MARYECSRKRWFVSFTKKHNAERYLVMLNDKLENHTAIHEIKTFMHDDVPYHRAKITSD